MLNHRDAAATGDRMHYHDSRFHREAVFSFPQQDPHD